MPKRPGVLKRPMPASFIDVVRREIEANHAVGFGSRKHPRKTGKTLYKDWTHPSVRTALRRELNHRIFWGTELDPELLTKLSTSKTAGRDFIREKGLTLIRGNLILRKELEEVIGNCEALMRLSDQIAARKKISVWELEANDALGHLVNTLYNRAIILKKRLRITAT